MQTHDNSISTNGPEFLARFSPATAPLNEQHFVDGSYEWRSLHPLKEDAVLDHLIACLFDRRSGSSLRSDLEGVVEPDDWVTICPLRIGYGNGNDCNKDGDELILLFTVCPGSTTPMRAAEIIRQARQVALSHDARLSNLAIEVAEEDIDPAVSKYLRIPPVGLGQGYDDTYCKNPLPGASIGLHGCHDSGSVGAYIRITFQDGGVDYFACTSHHLSKDAILPSTGPELTINCPSDQDHQSFCEKFHAFQSQGLGQYGLVQPAGQLLKECCSFDRTLGTIFCSSGLRCDDDNYIMDWALIKLANERFPSFQHLTNIPSDDVFLQYYGASHIEGLTQTLRQRPDGSELSINQLKTELARGGISVFKNGRSSGPTAGWAHHIEPSVRVTYKLVLDKEKLLTLKGHAVLVWTRSNFESRIFGQPGDSGALVLDQKAHAVGSLLSVTKLPRPTAHVTPWEATHRDMVKMLNLMGRPVSIIEIL